MLPNTQVVGTCSLCGGAVTLPYIWMAVIPAVPTCSQCGAVAAMHGPVMPMQPAPYKIVTSNKIFIEPKKD
jgi:hypothetical protein